MENIFKKKKDNRIIVKVLICGISMLVIAFFIYNYINYKEKTIINNSEELYNDGIIENEDLTSQENKQEMDEFSDSMAVMNMLKSGNFKSLDKKIAYLTFDDGPSITITPKILDILKENKINGTFFIVGNEVDKSDISRELLKRIVEEGNTIGAHTYSHNYKKLYPDGKIDTSVFIDEIEKTNKLIIDELGEKNRTRVIRFPGGSYSWKGISEVEKLLAEKGYSYIDWNCVIGDAEGKPKNKDGLVEVFNETKTKVAGDGNLVVLMHDTYGKEATVEALPEIINKLKNEGYEFHTLI